MTASDHLQSRLALQPETAQACRQLQQAFDILVHVFEKGHKLLICGNGGSCADAEHIAGELLKGFLLPRPLPQDIQGQLPNELAQGLQQGLPVISLCGHPAMQSAWCNDAEPTLVYAQQVIALGRSGDVLLAISTSGNSVSCRHAAVTAKALGLTTIALTGKKPSKLSEISTLTIHAPATETYRIQEYHECLYHTLCAMLESHFFG